MCVTDRAHAYGALNGPFFGFADRLTISQERRLANLATPVNDYHRSAALPSRGSPMSTSRDRSSEGLPKFRGLTGEPSESIWSPPTMNTRNPSALPASWERIGEFLLELVPGSPIVIGGDKFPYRRIESSKLECGDKVRHPSHLVPRNIETRTEEVRFGTLNVCGGGINDKINDVCELMKDRPYRRVKRNDLWRTLSMNGLSSRLIQALQSLYRGSRASIRINGAYTDWFDNRRGVREGYVASP
ncbi:hypothetical protein EVAR_95601_1 [Eumeta japonica]|uniref:Uncharacterized protein n=1 Tax=Eumeta variegata TaxID=151549 RepID=A0A4C1VKC0_EUMVA|nr:hypothetical protein EVAR_95601_1 [Eumeta japonica]